MGVLQGGCGRTGRHADGGGGEGPGESPGGEDTRQSIVKECTVSGGRWIHEQLTNTRCTRLYISRVVFAASYSAVVFYFRTYLSHCLLWRQIWCSEI